MTKKVAKMTSVRFEKTTKGHIAYVKQGIEKEQIAWFIREEMNSDKTVSLNLYGVYRSDDGGRGFKLIPRENVNSDSECFYPSLKDAQKFVYSQYFQEAEKEKLSQVRKEGKNTMKIGDYVETPRFLKVRISEVFDDLSEAHKQGFTEPTHFEGDHHILGRIIGDNRMTFAAVAKERIIKEKTTDGEQEVQESGGEQNILFDRYGYEIKDILKDLFDKEKEAGYEGLEALERVLHKVQTEKEQIEMMKKTGNINDNSYFLEMNTINRINATLNKMLSESKNNSLPKEEAEMSNSTKTATEVKEASKKQIQFMEAIAEASGLEVSQEARENSQAARKWISEGLKYCEENGIEIGKSTKAPENAAKEASQKQIKFMEELAAITKLPLPERNELNSKVAQEWIEETLNFCRENDVVIGKGISGNITSDKQLQFMEAIKEASGFEITEEAKQNSKDTSDWIQAGLKHCDENGIVIGKSTKTPDHEAKEATKKQQEFMQTIAEASGLAIPDEAFSNSKEASKWIKESLDYCKENSIVIASEKQAVLYEAKEALGSNSFITNAQNNASYEGKIIASSEHYVVQEVMEGKGILHSLENNPDLKNFLETEADKDMSVRISYDKTGQASIGNAADINKELNMEMEDENEL